MGKVLAFFTLFFLGSALHALTLLDQFNSGQCPLMRSVGGQIFAAERAGVCLESYRDYFAQTYANRCGEGTNCQFLVNANGEAARVSRDRMLDLSRNMSVIDEVIEALSVIWTSPEQRERLGIEMNVDGAQLRKVLIGIGLTELTLRNADGREAFSEGLQDLLSQSPILGRTMSGGGRVGEVGVGDGNPTVGVFQVSQELAYQMEDRYLRHTNLATPERTRISDQNERLIDRNRRIRGDLPRFRKNAAVAAANLLHLLLYAHNRGFDLTRQPGLLARYYHRGIGHMGDFINAERAQRLSMIRIQRAPYDYSSSLPLIPRLDSYGYFVESNWDTVDYLAAP